jgi:hypothetical protein
MRPSTLGMWMALSVIDPWDDNRADLRAGQIAAAAVNAQGATKRDGEPFVPIDFMVYHDAQIDQDALAEQREIKLAAKIRETLMNLSGHKAKVE